MKLTTFGLIALAAGLVGCATENSRSLQVAKVESAASPFSGQRVPVSVGKFDNRSSFMRGVFSSGEDRLGNQAQTILVSHLQQSQRFNVLDRTLMSEMQQEAQLKRQAQNIKGADYILTGDVTEFGRKEVGPSAVRHLGAGQITDCLCQSHDQHRQPKNLRSSLLLTRCRRIQPV